VYHQLILPDAIAMDKYKTTRRMDNITTLPSEILKSVAAIITRTSPTPLIDTVNLYQS
jgi:hypothetical protein